MYQEETMTQSYPAASTPVARASRCVERGSAARYPRLLATMALAAMAGLWQVGAQAVESVKIAAFDGSFINFPLYVANDLHLFEKHGVNAELIYGTGIQT